MSSTQRGAGWRHTASLVQQVAACGVDRTISEKLQTCMNLHKLLQEYGGSSRCEAELHRQTSSSAF